MQVLIYCAILYLLIGVMVLAFICAFLPPPLLKAILHQKLILPVIVQTTLFWPLLVWRNVPAGGAPSDKTPEQTTIDGGRLMSS